MMEHFVEVYRIYQGPAKPSYDIMSWPYAEMFHLTNTKISLTNKRHGIDEGVTPRTQVPILISY